MTDQLPSVVTDGLTQLDRALAAFSQLGRCGMLPKSVQSPADAALLAAFGSTYGLDPLQSVMRLHIIEGRPSLPAETMVALVKRHPSCQWWHLVSSTDDEARYATQRVGEPAPTELAYSIEQARNAGLAGRGTWKAHPAAMLRARCASALARIVYPDVVGGLYDHDEAREAAGEYREQPHQQSPGRVYDIRPSEPVQVAGLEHRAIEAELVPEPRGPRDWWDGWRAACAGIGLAFPDALAIMRGDGIDTDDEGTVRAAWPVIEQRVRKLSRAQQPSRSREAGYELHRGPSGWRCNCEAGSFGRGCVHAKAAEVAWWRGLMLPSAWATIAAVCGDVPADDKLDEALGLIRSWRDMMTEGDA